MKLLPTATFSARLASPPTDMELPSCELLLDGKPSGLIVTGAVLETALEWQGCSIAFFTDDIPYEDMLRIYMFDANMTLVDSAVLGSRYSTGTFAELNLLPPNLLTFRFFGGTVWRLVLLDKQEFALPFLSDPGGVSRKFKFFRHFRIEGKPQPEGACEISNQRDKAPRTQVATSLPRGASGREMQHSFIASASSF
nr:hypothetical protein [uncultured Duganella sp.]